MIIKIEQNDGCKTCAFNNGKDSFLTNCYFQNGDENMIARRECNLINKRIELKYDKDTNGYVKTFLDKVNFKVKLKKCKICGSTNSTVSERHFMGYDGVDIYRGELMCSHCFNQEMFEDDE